VLTLLTIGLGVVWVKAFWLQHVNVEQWQKRAESRFERVRDLSAARGRLLDRNGDVLAVSISEYRVGLVPRLFDVGHPRVSELAALMNLSPSELRRRVQSAKGFFYVTSGLDMGAADKVRALKVPGIELEQEFRRYYPHGPAFANLVGFTDLKDQGQEGLELAFNTRLQGKPGVERVVVDRQNRVFDKKTYDPASPGQDLRLSFDAGIQAIAYAAAEQALIQHQAKSVSVVVVDSRTGEVLAMANAPSFDPNQRTRLDPNRVRNRAVTDTFEPGSTIKPFTIAAALDAKVVSPGTSLSTDPGRMVIDGRTIRDTKTHGTLTVSEILEKSSNVGTIRIAQKVSSDVFYQKLRASGFGEPSQIRLPAEPAGRLRPWQSWAAVDKATVSFGHGMSVSLVQLAGAYTVFARDGDRVALSLSHVAGPVVGQPVFSPETARAVRRMLERAAGPEGTGPKARITGFRVAGKTGTAHKPEAGGYAKAKYLSSFVGLVPADQPRFVIAVAVDEPAAGRHFGGEVAAPVFAQVANESLRRMQMSPDPSVRVVPAVTLVEEGT
jgi:cell division protein FtsI (penicillin-binding protein 3)